MNDGDTDLPPLDEPFGPRARPPLQRTAASKYWVAYFDELLEMSKNKGKRKNVSPRSSSLPNTSIPSPTSVTPTKMLNSPGNEDGIRHRGGTNSPPLYPILPESENSQLDKSYTSTPEKSGSRSPNDTQTPKASGSDSSFNKDDESFNETTLLPPGNEQQLALRNQAEGSRENTKSHAWWLYGSISVVLCCLFFGTSSTTYETDKTSDIQYLKSNINDLKRLFPSQDEETWSTFGSGILDVQSKNHTPAVFILVSDHNETNNCLAKRVAEVARDILEGTGDVILNPNKLENDIGKVHTLMANRMNMTKVVVFPDLLSFQPKAFQAFHEICDEYNTLVSEAIYIFTMNYVFHSKSDTLIHFVEKQLTHRFSNDINQDTLGPLIIRLTAGGVLLIKREENIPCSK